MKYRAELDGLRALAIIPVILYHAGFKLFEGGYVGVDVFFVISGYLITSILLAELDAGTFSVVNFYERRARRILPALFLVMLICLPFSWFMLTPEGMKRFSSSYVAVLIFLSNVYFWGQSGYFDSATELKPLVHTWSLAIEEQFYFLFPLFLLLTWRLGKRWIIGLLCVVFLVGLTSAQWLYSTHPSFNFYMLPTRGWELLIGAFIAFYHVHHNFEKYNRNIEQLGSVFGLLLIGYSVFSYNNKTPFPSLYTLVPTLGAALIIIFASNKTVIGKLLGSKMFVAIGLISYGAYLWHQPMFAFVRESSLDEPNIYLMSAMAVLSFAFAYLGWKYVERPFRNKHRFSRAKIFTYGAFCSVFFIVIGFTGYLTNGYSDNKRWDGIQNALAIQRTLGSGEVVCHESKIAYQPGFVQCVIGDKSIEPDGVLWGDSLAAALSPGLNEELLLKKHSLYAVFNSGCVPIGGAYRPNYALCQKDINEKFIQEFIKDKKLNKLIWFGSFHDLAEGDRADYLIDGAESTPLLFENKFNKTLDRFIDVGKKVVIVGDTPRFPRPVAEYAIKSYLISGGKLDKTVQNISKQEQLNQTQNLNHILNDAMNKALVVDGYSVFCNDDKCSSHDANGDLMFVDKNHLSMPGAIKLGKVIVDLLY